MCICCLMWVFFFFFIGLDETVCSKGEEGESWIETEMAQAQNPRVMPNCLYASNPYHECTENCLHKIKEFNSKKPPKNKKG
jgi:hypothetical protein